MANTSKEMSIKYISKDFEAYKRDLMRYAQAHFSGSYQDFNETSPGMMILELQAYIADSLSFYMDQQFLETKAATARQLGNVEDFAKMRGYKPKGKRSARVVLDFIIEVPSIEQDGSVIPDPDYLPILRAGSQAQGPGGVIFEILEDLDFGKSTSDNPQKVVPVPDSQPPTVAVRRWVEAIAGKTQVDQIPVGDYERFKRIVLGANDVQEILSVYDREGNQWYEVEYLAQNAVFDQIVNTEQDSDTVPYILKLQSAARRFFVDRNVANNTTALQFGSGEGLKFDDQLIPNIADMALPIDGRQQFSNFTLDPQNFLKTRTLGLTPHNTTLTVTYRTGGGVVTNVPAYSIKKVINADLSFPKSIGGVNGLDPTIVQSVKQIEVFNTSSANGGGDAETVAEIKANASSYFAAQSRAVTREDFITHILSMPSRFGKPERVFVKHSEGAQNGVEIHLITVDSYGKFTLPTPSLMKNIKTYLRKLRLLTQGISVMSCDILNIGIQFGIVTSPKYNRTEVMTNCLLEVKKYFDNSNMQIGMPIVLSDVRAKIQAVQGVISVYKFDVDSRVSEDGLQAGGAYSNKTFDVKGNTRNGIIYCPQNAIFEVRNPDNDIGVESK